MSYPGHSALWLQLAWLTEDRRERLSLLRQVLSLDPDHRQARAEMARFQTRRGRRIPGKAVDRGRGLGWVGLFMALSAGVMAVIILAWASVDASANATPLNWLPALSPTPAPTPRSAPGEIAARFVPQLRTALSEKRWDRALEIVAIMSSVDPSGDEVRQWVYTTTLHYGVYLVHAGRASEAQAQFDQAALSVPEDAQAHLWQQTTGLYLAGREAFEAGRWEAAIQSFTLAQEKMADFPDLKDRLVETYRRQAHAALADGHWTDAIDALVRAHQQLPGEAEVEDLLASAYRQRGMARHEQSKSQLGRVDLNKLREAESDLEAALDLRPDDPEAKAHLEQVTNLLHPPKRLEVDISEQRLYVWEGDRLIYEFPVSTGLPGQDTATGHFQVLDKIPMAYSRIWKLSMPNWMGIYWVQGIENGFHALPIRPDGSVMWAGLLGRRASYGCIVLGTEAAKIVYNWAEIGTAVEIHN